jgi:hypothetical protein
MLGWVAALLNTSPMLFLRTSRIAIKPIATRAMIKAYSTSPLTGLVVPECLPYRLHRNLYGIALPSSSSGYRQFSMRPGP